MKQKVSQQNKIQNKKLPLNFPIILIGGSAGSFHSLVKLLYSIPIDIGAAICVVMHLAVNSNATYLLKKLQENTSFRCCLATEGDEIRTGTLYLAIPKTQMLLVDRNISFGNGPDENRFKPSIDVLFRSAAVEYRERAIGIILSGMLDDGVAGMAAIRACGGACIVQDPTDAEYPDLPVAVLTKGIADYSIPISEMSKVLVALTQHRRKPVKKIPPTVAQEAAIAEKMLTDINETKKLGVQSLFTCPDCGGVLFHLQDQCLSRYRCFTGHAYSEDRLLEKQNEALLLTLWTSMRMFEERKKLLERMPESVNTHKRKADLNHHISILKNLLTDIRKLSADRNTDDNSPMSGD